MSDRGPTILRDGTVISAGLNVGSYQNAHKDVYSNHGLEIGQIEAIYTVDDENNINQSVETPTSTRYDVRVVRANGHTDIIARCRAAQPLFGGGLNNYFEVLPTDPGFNGKADVFRDFKRGHIVLIGYVGGFKNQGVILGAMPHTNPVAIQKRPKKGKGVYSEGEIQGLNFSVDNDGAPKVVFNGPRDDQGSLVNANGPTTIEVKANGNIHLSTNNKQDIVVDRVAGKIHITNGPTYIDMDQAADKIQVVATTVEVGTNTLQPQVVGDDWKKIMERLLTAIENIIVPTGVGPSGNPINRQEFEAIRLDLKEALSRNHKVEK